MKVLLAVPVSHAPMFPPAWVQAFADLVAHETARGTDLRSFFPAAYAVTDSRNRAVRHAMERETDGILWLDSDTVPPRDVLERLTAWGEPIVAGWYHFKGLGSHGFPPSVMVDGRFVRPDGEALMEADRVGFGCVWTAMAVFHALDEPWFAAPGPGGSHEDWYFCDRVRDAGFRIRMDPSVRCKHYFPPGPFYIDESGRLTADRGPAMDSETRERLGYAVRPDNRP